MRRKIGIAFLVVALVGCLFIASTKEASAAPRKWGATILNLESTGNSKIDEFINDSRWTNGASYNGSTQPKTNSSASFWGCAAYCYDYTNYCYGKANPRSGTAFSNINEIQAGDVVTVGNQSDGTGHWFVVLKRSGNSLYVAEGNYANKVRIGWNYTISGSKFAEDSRNFTTGYHYYPSINTTPVVTFSAWESSRGNTYIAETDASIGQQFTVSGGTATDTGMYLYDANGNLLGQANNGKYYSEVYFKINEELHVTLTIDTVYKYQFFVVVNGQTFKSSVGSFRTKGYTIKYNANCGTGAPGVQKKSQGKDLTLSSTIPSKTGYDFLGWSTSSTATSAQYSAGGKYTSDASVTLYAVWKIKQYTVSYNANGGTGAPGSQTKTYGTDLVLSSNKPSKDGYDFLGWATSSNASSAQYSAGGKYTNNASVTLYAVWKIKQYTVSFNANGGTGAPGAQTKTHGTDLVLSSNKPSKDGYDFLGWATSSNASSAQYSAGGKYTNNASVTLYAVWKIKQYTVSYNANGGTGAPGAQTIIYGTNLVLSSVKPIRDGYDFQGWATSSTATTAQYAPGATYTANASVTLYAVWKRSLRVVDNPYNTAVEAGATATFVVYAEGTGQLYYQWQSRKNSSYDWADSKQSGNKTDSLDVEATASLHGYQFRCRITDNYGGEVYSSVATLSVKPKITLQPVDKSLVVGSTAKFTVEATGKATLTYQWQYRKNANCSWADSGQTGARTATLLVSTTEALHGYQFRCVVTDGNGQKSYTKTVTLNLNPKITTQPVDKSLMVGSTAKFTVEATGKATLTYQWQYRKNANSSWADSGQNGAKTATLLVSTTEALHGYQFRCVVTDGNGRKSYSSAATLTMKPRITTQPVDKSLLVGSTAKFTVEATGKATLSYQWQYRKNANCDWADSGQTGAKTSTLLVSTTAALSGYQFRCVVTDGNGQKSYSSIATLTLKPRITTQPADKRVTVGNTAKFTVEATGKATLTYQWQYRKNSSCAWADSGQSGNKTATLSVASTAGLHGYQFRCVVTDGNGEKSYSGVATLSIIPKITTQPSNVVATAGKTVTFAVAATGTETLKYQWQYKAPNADSWSNMTKTDATTAKMTINASTKLTGYQYRCVVTDGNGQKAYSIAAMIVVQ